MSKRSRADSSLLAAAAEGVQDRIEAFYRLDDLPRIHDYLRLAKTGARESVLIRQIDDGEIEMAVVAPRPNGPEDLDGHCQVIEGVSHFVFVAERARRGLPVTHLELELQAEIDKFVVLAVAEMRFETERARLLCQRLYDEDHVRFCDPPGTEPGDRYRLANDLAARYVHRLSASYAEQGRMGDLRNELVRFYGVGQSEKIELAMAA